MDKRYGTKKSRRDTEQVRKAFLLENDSEKNTKYPVSLSWQSNETKPSTKFVLVRQEPSFYLEFNKTNKENVSEIICLKKKSTFPSRKITVDKLIGTRNETSRHHIFRSPLPGASICGVPLNQPCVCSVIDVKSGKRRQNVLRTSVTHSAISSCATFLFLPHFDVI